MIYAISKEDKERIHHACMVIKNDANCEVNLQKGKLTLERNNEKILAFTQARRGRGYSSDRKEILSYDLTGGYDKLENELQEKLSKQIDSNNGNSSTRAKAKYAAKTYDQCLIYFQKGSLKQITERIKNLGYESKNIFIKEAINEKLEREEKK